MAAFSTYLANEILDHILRDESFTAPTSVFLALHTADNGLEAGTITGEVSGGSYAREELGNPTPNFTAAASSATSNDAQISFTTATASWGTITHVSIMDASTAGNVLFHGALAASKVIGNGDTFIFGLNELDLDLA